MEVAIGNLAKSIGGEVRGTSSTAGDPTTGHHASSEWYYRSSVNTTGWKRGDIHPETGKIFWAVNRGREWWKTPENFSASELKGKQWHKNRPPFIGPKQWKFGDVNPQTGLVFVQYAGKGWSQSWMTKEKFKSHEEKLRVAVRERRRANPEKYRRLQKENDLKNRGRRAAKLREARAKNPEHYRQKAYAWIKKNPERRKEIVRKWARKAAKNNPMFRIRRNLSSRIWELLFRKNATKSNGTLKILGCSLSDFRVHLESLFLPDMSWNNYGPYSLNGPRMWCIEHIIPCAIASTPLELEALFHYTNLRPFWSKENSDKSDFLPCGTRARHKRQQPIV